LETDSKLMEKLGTHRTSLMMKFGEKRIEPEKQARA
jgi:hypothetical protein